MKAIRKVLKWNMKKSDVKEEIFVRVAKCCCTLLIFVLELLFCALYLLCKFHNKLKCLKEEAEESFPFF